MNFPITGTAALWLAVGFGFVFGWLLQKGGVTRYNVIVNQFRLRDFTVLDIKNANLLGVALGAAIFGAGMVIYGYCPGTGVAAIATGSVHALVGGLGMLVGGILYALSFTWVNQHILSVAALGKLRLPEMTGIPSWAWFIVLVAIAAVVFYLIEKRSWTTRTRND